MTNEQFNNYRNAYLEMGDKLFTFLNDKNKTVKTKAQQIRTLLDEIQEEILGKNEQF